jgi:hypothetical protein
MSKLEEAPRPTPILDAIEERSALVGGLLREGARWFKRIRQRRAQKHIDKTWHAKVGEREDP